MVLFLVWFILQSYSVPEIELSPQIGTDYSPVCIQNAVANLEELEVKNPTFLVKAGVWVPVLSYSSIYLILNMAKFVDT